MIEVVIRPDKARLIADVDRLIRGGLLNAAETLLLEHLADYSPHAAEMMRSLARVRSLQGRADEALSLLKHAASVSNGSADEITGLSNQETARSRSLDEEQFFGANDLDVIEQIEGRKTGKTFAADYTPLAEPPIDVGCVGHIASNVEGAPAKQPSPHSTEDHFEDVNSEAVPPGGHADSEGATGSAGSSNVASETDRDSESDGDSADLGLPEIESNEEKLEHLDALDESLETSTFTENAEAESSELEFLLPEDLEEFEEERDALLDDQADVVVGGLAYDERVTQQAVSFVIAIGWEEEWVALFEDIFSVYGYSRTKQSLRKVIEAGVSPELLQLAFECRLLWIRYPEFHAALSFGYVSGTRRIPYFKALSWPAAVELAQSYTEIPDIEEIEVHLLGLYEQWRRHAGSASRFYNSFYGYLAYCLARARGLGGILEWSFDPGEPWSESIFDEEVIGRDFSLERDLFEFGLIPKPEYGLYPRCALPSRWQDSSGE